MLRFNRTPFDFAVNQAAHGFSNNDMVYWTGSAYALAKADNIATSSVVGMVTVINVDNFRLTVSGFSGLTGLTPNTAYFLSDTVAGAYSTTPGIIRVNLLYADANGDAIKWDDQIYDRGIIIIRGTGVTTTLGGWDYLLNCTTASIIVNLPTAVGIHGKTYVIKNSAGSGNVTVDGAGTETIDGSTTASVTPGSSLTIVSDGANWLII